MHDATLKARISENFVSGVQSDCEQREARIFRKENKITNSSSKIVGDARDLHHKDNWSTRRIFGELIIFRKTTS